jgi:hypothetical protein
MTTLSSLNSTLVLLSVALVLYFFMLEAISTFFYIFFFAEGTSNERQNKGDSNISRKASRGFNLLECQSLPMSQLTDTLGNSINVNDLECEKDVCVCYKLPGGSSELNLV